MHIEFQGVVHPRRIIASFSREGITIAYRDVKGTAKVSYEVNNSQVRARAIFDRELLSGEFSDIGTLSGAISSAIQSELNIFNVANGTWLEVEIEHYSDGEEWRKLQVAVPVINERNDTAGREQMYQNIFALLQRSVVAQVYLNPILVDMNRAMRYPTDTGFYCYRAFETMAKYFCESMKATVKPRHITAMIDATRTDREDFELLKKYADAVRHGNVIPISSAVRATLFTASWNFLDGFVAFSNNDFSGIKSSYEKDCERENGREQDELSSLMERLRSELTKR